MQPETIQELLVSFMISIEAWSSDVEGKPTQKNMKDLDAIYFNSEQDIRRRLAWERGEKGKEGKN